MTEGSAVPEVRDAAAGGALPPATPSSTAIPISSMTALDPALYVPQELRQPPRRDPYEVDDAINIIEEGEHVSAEDFGLSSTEISMSAAITMNVGMELNAMQQIDAFLAARPSAEPMASDSTQIPVVQPHLQRPVQREDPSIENSVANKDSSINARSERVTTQPVDATPVKKTTGTPSASTVTTTATATSASSAVAYPTRRDDKVLQLDSHPLVESVASDGRNVVCKCGKNVRLNPPWYIVKYEQHLVSRNCTFLRKKKSKRDQAAQEKMANARADATGADADASITVSTDSRSADSVSESRTDQARDSGSHDDATGSDAARLPVDYKYIENDEHYELKTIEELCRRYRRPKCTGEPDKDTEMEKIVDTLDVLKRHPHFSRITPDGKFLECTCSELIILSAPWGLREFHAHVDAKSKPQAPPRRKSSTASSTKRPRLGDGAAYRVDQRLIVRETRWKPVSKHIELPCPGLRGERIGVYINSTTRTTGGSRARRRIAEELFPHRFSSTDNDKKPRPRLTLEEKLMLRDAVESEALWFIDHDANAVRSLDCRGSIAANKDEDCCASCSELRVNASLRISVTVAMGHKRIPDDTAAPTDTPATPTKRKTSAAAFALLEQEFNMAEEYARLLRDLFRADVEESSVKNVWFEMAELGISSLFTPHPAFLGLVESMMALKGKERRGVGLQNMAYSDHLDSFMKSLSDVSPQACDFFQQQLGGRKQKYLMTMKKRRIDSEKEADDASKHSTATAQEHVNIDPSTAVAASSALSPSTDSYTHLPFDLTGSTAMQSLGDMHDVDLSSFHADQPPAGLDPTADEAEHDETDAFLTDEGIDILQEDIDDGSVRTIPTSPSPFAAIIPGHIPCRGLRDPKVQAYVVNAVQIIGGSRPKYVIAKELFPEAFDGSRKIKIMEMLSEHERGMVLDAIFSECLWRVDRLSKCVRSLRCFRRVDRRRTNGVCRACLDLKSIANFRSVLCRAKVPKNVANLKYVPSVYTESDPFMRKLSKNASLRMLYQTVKRVAPDDKKKVTFWLRLAKMGLFGHFRSHVVFEGLIASMVELKDRERRGVGKQNMLYAKSLDEFMAALATISMDAFELFSHHFCGRTTRSQKVKKRKALTQLYDSAIQQAMVANSLAMASASVVGGVVAPSVSLDMAVRVSQSDQTPTATSTTPTTTATLASSTETHAMVMSDDLLEPARPISTAELEENQRFMDRMLDEVRLSVTHDDHEPDEHLDPQTYLDENGVLTTVL